MRTFILFVKISQIFFKMTGVSDHISPLPYPEWTCELVRRCLGSGHFNSFGSILTFSLEEFLLVLFMLFIKLLFCYFKLLLCFECTNEETMLSNEIYISIILSNGYFLCEQHTNPESKHSWTLCCLGCWQDVHGSRLQFCKWLSSLYNGRNKSPILNASLLNWLWVSLHLNQIGSFCDWMYKDVAEQVSGGSCYLLGNWIGKYLACAFIIGHSRVSNSRNLCFKCVLLVSVIKSGQLHRRV